MGRKPNNWIGRRFGHLTVTEELPRYLSATGAVRRSFRATCDCTNTITVDPRNLSTGNTQSCGCREGNRKHGEAGNGKRTIEYRTWRGMIKRCENPATVGYENYGGRGIKVCKRWRDSYEAFLRDMGRRPSPQHSIDRKDNDGDYEPGNCQWATRKDQANNRRPMRPRKGTASLKPSRRQLST